MDQWKTIIASLDKAIEDGHTVTIKADDLTIQSGGETVINGLEITIE